MQFNNDPERLKRLADAEDKIDPFASPCTQESRLTIEEWFLRAFPGANLDKLEIGARLAIQIAKSYAESELRKSEAPHQDITKWPICLCGHKARSHGSNWHGESPEKEATGFSVCHYPGCNCNRYCGEKGGQPEPAKEAGQ